MSEKRHWFQSDCWNCQTINWIDNGFLSDLTARDVEGFVCFQCRSNNLFDEDGCGIETEYEQIDYGLPSPSTD